MTYADKPWLKSYKLGPYKLDHSLAPYPEEPVYKALDDAAEKHPGQTAVLYLDRKIKYRELKLLSKTGSGPAGAGRTKGRSGMCFFTELSRVYHQRLGD